MDSYFHLVWLSSRRSAPCSTPSGWRCLWCSTRASSRCRGYGSICYPVLWHGGRTKTQAAIRKESPPPRAVPLVTTGLTSSPRLFLPAGVVVWRAVVFVRRLSRPALASFPCLGHSDCASVGSAFPGVAAHLWDNGGWLGRWAKNGEEKFGGKHSIQAWFLEFAVKCAVRLCNLVKSVYLGQSLDVTIYAQS